MEGLSDNVNIVSTLTAASGKLGFHSLRFGNLGEEKDQSGPERRKLQALRLHPEKEPSPEVKGQIHGVLGSSTKNFLGRGEII